MGEKTKLKKVDGEKLLEKLPKAILEGANVRSIAKAEGLSQVNATSLVNAIGTPIEEFNAKLATKLGEVADEYLDEIRAQRKNMPAASLAYTFAVLVDKKTAITGRTNPAGSSVNVQINNHGLNLSKEEIMDLLQGKKKAGGDDEGAAGAVEIPTEPTPPLPPAHAVREQGE